MTSKQYIKDEHYFGKYQRLITVTVLILTFQLPFFLIIGLVLYGIITLNSMIIATVGMIIIFTYPVKRNQLFIKLVRKYLVPTAYFKDFYRIFQEEIPEQEKALFCFHPHSVLSYGQIANMNCGQDKMTNMIGLVSRFIYNVPISGLVFRLFGMQTVDPANLNHLMKQGRTIGMVPGGFQQASLTTPQQMRIYIKKRAGFIKYAIKHGYTIYPTLVFNEHKMFATFDHLLWLRHQINKFKFPAVVFMSKWWLFLNPNFQMITVVGKGIKLQNKMPEEQPTKQQIHEIQDKYIKQIQRMYEKHKHLNGNSPLVIY